MKHQKALENDLTGTVSEYAYRHYDLNFSCDARIEVVNGKVEVWIYPQTNKTL